MDQKHDKNKKEKRKKKKEKKKKKPRSGTIKGAKAPTNQKAFNKKAIDT